MVTQKRKTTPSRGMRQSRDGKTVGICLRLDTDLLGIYAEIAARANSIEVKNGGKGGLTAQDVMRHRLGSLPVAAKRMR